MKKPWIVYKRMLGVVFPVSRFKHADKAKAKVRGQHTMENLYCAHIDDLSADMKEALGIK